MIGQHRGDLAWAWRKTAQLRQVALTLKRAKNATRRRALLQEFDVYRRELLTRMPHPRTPDAEVILAGFQVCWATGDYAMITEVVSRLPPDWLQPPSLIGAYAAAASKPADGPTLFSADER